MRYYRQSTYKSEPYPAEYLSREDFVKAAGPRRTRRAEREIEAGARDAYALINQEDHMRRIYYVVEAE